ncbi:MAG: cytochrome c biogenesis protein CcsA [Opitutaceae bacterium]|nr:cytochrome c biogenesis protein CcsA [Opitutaceae bacterium]
MKRILPFLVLILAIGYLASSLFSRRQTTEFDLEGFGKLPVLVNGRLKPMDTVARTSLLMFQGRQAVKNPAGAPLKPVAWLLDVLFRPELADHYQHFEIVHPDVLAMFNLTTEQGAAKKRFSYAQLSGKLGELDRQAQLAAQTEAPVRTPFQKAVVDLREHLVLYNRLKQSLVLPDSANPLDDYMAFQKGLEAGVAAIRAREQKLPFDEAAANATLALGQKFEFMANMGYLLAVPPPENNPDPNAWKPVGAVLLETIQTRQLNASAMAYAGMAHAWRLQQSEHFNTIVKLFRKTLEGRYGERLEKSDIETSFNAAEPFYRSMVLYLCAFLGAVVSWLFSREVLGRSAFLLMTLAWIATTVGIGIRMWLEGRPPVTNLYSSALFVGWGAVGLCLILEFVYRNAIGSAAGGMVGFCTLVIAHYLSLSGDTLEMMRAVLDSNFWLATHVVVVTIGYSATYLAGFLALIYVFRGVFTRSLDAQSADAINRMVYGIICFATLFSLVGTVLGGIWADQSWGRFWGWDPKENGALIIVLWNGLILHARWGGMVKARGLMSLAIFGNIVTSWSWFGTNMLGVGLHSYGFMDSAFYALLLFALSQLLAIGIGCLPEHRWRSFTSRANPAPQKPVSPVAA